MSCVIIYKLRLEYQEEEFVLFKEKKMTSKQKEIGATLLILTVLGLITEAYLGVEHRIYDRELRIINTALPVLFLLYLGMCSLVNRAKARTRPYY